MYPSRKLYLVTRDAGVCNVEVSYKFIEISLLKWFFVTNLWQNRLQASLSIVECLMGYYCCCKTPVAPVFGLTSHKAGILCWALRPISTMFHLDAFFPLCQIQYLQLPWFLLDGTGLSLLFDILIMLTFWN